MFDSPKHFSIEKAYELSQDPDENWADDLKQHYVSCPSCQKLVDRLTWGEEPDTLQPKPDRFRLLILLLNIAVLGVGLFNFGNRVWISAIADTEIQQVKNLIVENMESGLTTTGYLSSDLKNRRYLSGGFGGYTATEISRYGISGQETVVVIQSTRKMRIEGTSSYGGLIIRLDDTDTAPSYPLNLTNFETVTFDYRYNASDAIEFDVKIKNMDNIEVQSTIRRGDGGWKTFRTRWDQFEFSQYLDIETRKGASIRTISFSIDFQDAEADTSTQIELRNLRFE